MRGTARMQLFRGEEACDRAYAEGRGRMYRLYSFYRRAESYKDFGVGGD